MNVEDHPDYLNHRCHKFLGWSNRMRVEEIKAAIERLPGPEFIEIRKWVAERDWQTWDQELEADSKAGKLDSPIK